MIGAASLHRRGRPVARGMVAVLATAVLVALAPSAHADDDYPYSGLGECPVAPPPPTPTPMPGQPTPTQPPAPTGCLENVWYLNGSKGDAWGFVLRHCTSFVAWRMRSFNGVDFSNDMAGGHWGDAKDWDENARALGYRVDDVPAIGAIAQTDEGIYGHVAWVSAVDGDTVTIEEYNHGTAGGYGIRTVPASDFRYLHVADVAPAPSSGSARTRVPVVDDAGHTWTSWVSPGGDLLVQSPTGRATTVGANGGWSSYSSPAVAVDGDGRVWVAAIRADGGLRVVLSQGRRGWSEPRAVSGGWSTTSSPALVVDGTRVRLFGVSAAGDLLEHVAGTQRPARWSRAMVHGLPGLWSPYAAPSATVDASGRTWLGAVTALGGVMLRHLDAGDQTWSEFTEAGGGPFATISGPTLTTSGEHTWLHAVSADGHLVQSSLDAKKASWSRPQAWTGTWSTYASPAVTLDATGRAWLVAVSDSGRVWWSRTRDGSGTWEQPRPTTTVGDVVVSPALVPRGGASVRLYARQGDGRLTAQVVGRATQRPRALHRPNPNAVGA